MHRQNPPAAFGGATRRRQSGVYALEWAFIFPVFFALLYGIICYGLTFLVRSSMQYAVEEGARAALRYPLNSTPPNWNGRKDAASVAIQNGLNWLPTAMKFNSDFKFAVCLASDSTCSFANLKNGSTPTTPQTCSPTSPCMVLVSYAIPNYRDNAIAPAIPGLGLILPETLEAQAGILIDWRPL
ncbi:TadE/TadG family type IV pilus assembly protein [Alicycliphilus sp. T452]|jgi:Flp pilus assembly protein TadG